MHKLDWNDLRYLLAVHRSGTYSAAARHLGVDDTTVSRRVKSLQSAAGTELFERLPDASLRLTQAGIAVLTHAERMEREADVIGQTLGEEAGKIAGTVRITSVPIAINRFLVPALPALLTLHPDLTIELVPDARDFSLTRREADLAIRLARPTSGGDKVKARRIDTLTYGVFAAAGTRDPGALKWITYDDTMAHLPQSKWMRQTGAAATGLRVTDAETAMEAAACGIGKTLLPECAGKLDPRLVQIRTEQTCPPPERDVWLLSHADQRGFKNIRTVVDWIETIDWSERQ